jgi:uncharacterized repeat protein (TIGR01451 family)
MRGWRRGLTIGLVAALMGTSVAVLPAMTAAAAGTTLFEQGFHNNTANGTGAVVLPALPSTTTATNVACLTAAGNTTVGVLRSCPGATDLPGLGKLQLTDASMGKTGGVFGAASVPTSQGLDVTFNLYQWGGGSADGIAFALAAVDPANPLAPATLGQSGGSLGYSSTKVLAGLANGYLAIGFDVFGNFSTTTYEGTGCTDPAYITNTKIAGQVVVRGPGAGTVGYCALNSTANNVNSPVVPLRATTRSASQVPAEVAINPTAVSFTTASGLVVAAGTYKLVFTPVGGSARTLTGSLPTVPAGLYPSSTWTTSAGIPRQLAFGWVGSTGSVTDVHEVDTTRVVSFNPVPSLNVTQTSFNGSSPQPGDPVTYSVVAGVNVGANESATVTVSETVPTGVVPVGAFGTGWVCANPVGQKVTCTNANAPFANGTSLAAITVVGIVASASVTAALIQSTSVATSSSIDGNPGFSAATTVGTVAATPTAITVVPASSTIAGAIHVIVGGTNITGASAIEIGTTAEQQAGTPVSLLPCQSGAAPGCFTVNGDGTLDISSMPARANAATVTVTVVTRGVAGSASYVYTDKPAAPAAPTATAGLLSATVSWVAPASNGSPITGYIVTPTRNGVAQTPVSFDASTTTRTLSSLTAGASYTFTVIAVNALGNSAPSPSSAAVVPFSLPGQPTISAVSAGDSSATLTWTAPSNGGSPITSYVVTPFIGVVAQTPQTFPGTGTTQTLTGLTPGTAYRFTVAATNAGGTGPASALSTAVTPNVSPSLSNPAPPAGEVGAAYSDALAVNGGTAPFSWSVSVGSLPPGLSLASGTGLLSGTPTGSGSFPFTVRVTDASSQTATQALTVVIAAAPTLTFAAPPPGQVGVPYSNQLTVTGGTGPFAWSVTAGSLPPGLTLAPSTGLLSGTPTTAGNYSFTVKVLDAFGQSATKTVSLAVTASPSLSFPPPPAGQVGVAYNDPLTVTGGTAPFVWSVSGGTLPPGLSLAAGTGVLSGVPTTAGSYPFTVRVVDATGQSATEAVTLGIGAGPLVVVKTADVSTVASGGTVHYSVTVTNTGAAGFTGVTFADPLGGVLDDAVYNGDASATTGVVSFATPTLSWTGDLAAGASVVVTYSVTVATPDAGNLVLANTVTSTTLGTNCVSGSLDVRCSATVPVSALTIVKTADVSNASPGDVVHYTVTVSNVGEAPYTGAAFTDALANVLDDASYNGDAAVTAGSVSVAGTTLSWSGNLAVGQSGTITYSVTVSPPGAGNRSMANTAVSATLGNNCPSGGTDPRCTAVVTVLVPGLRVTVTADTATTTPGTTVNYTVVVANTGQTPYTGIAVNTSLAGLLDDASYNADAVASSGAVVFTSPNVSWTGNIAIGASVTVTFSATVADPDNGNKVLTVLAVSAAAGSNCLSGSGDPRCTAATTVLVPGLTVVKTAAVSSTTPGSVVGYTITVTNTGQTLQSGANISDSLAGVLDDASYNGDATASSGTVGFLSPTLSWTGSLAAGATASITYSVTVSDPDSGDRSLANTAVSTTVGANCAAGSADPRCTVVVAVLLPGLALTNAAAVSTTTPGSSVGFTVTIANTGQTAYTGASVSESLAGVLDDAAYDANATASSGTVTYAAPTLTWTGNLAVGATVTVQFSATVRNPDPGSLALTSTLVSAAVGNNCPAGGSDPACTVSVTVLVPGLTMVKTADTATQTPGGVIVYTITVTNSGQTPQVGASFADSLSNVLNDSTYNGDATASVGAVSYSAPTLSWVGTLAVGAVASISYSLTVLNPDPGDKTLVDTLVSSSAGSNCAAGSTDPACTAVVRVLVPGLTIVKTAATATTVSGAVLGYTLTVTNTGQTPYPAATVTDSLTGVLDDAVYNNDASASPSVGTLGFTSPDLSWTGALAPAASVTITYSVTVNDPDAGDLILTNTAVSTAVGSNCPTGGTDPRCTARVPVARLQIVEFGDPTTTTPGSVVRASGTYTNTGQVPYVGISVAIEGAGIGDDAVGNGDQTASSGTLTLGGTGAVWTGDIPVGATIFLTATLTVLDPDTGDRVITGSSTSSAPGNNCPPGGTDPLCTLTILVLLPGLSIAKTADTFSSEPGDTVGYTVTLTNSGETPYTAITVADSLAGVLDDATYNADAAASAGTLGFASQTLTWSGDLDIGAVVTITYTVTVLSPDPGDKTMVDTVTSAAVGSNCSAGRLVAGCTATVVVLTPGLTIAKTADATTAGAGDTLTYTVAITNSGQVAYTGISVADDLSGSLDDAAYNADASASAGTVTFTSPVLSWTGNVGLGATVTLTYTVTVDNPDLGDSSLVDTVTTAAVGTNCPVGGTDPRCSVTVAEVPSTTLTFTKTADVTSTTAGSVVHYTITVANSAAIPYVGAAFTDPLSGVLDDAAYGNDAAATGGATVTYTAPVLSFAGDVPATGSVVVTYTVTVHAAGGGGDGVLTNTVSSVSADSNCPALSTDPRCTEQVTVSSLHILSAADVTTVTPGGVVTFTGTFTNTGQTPYFGIAVDLGGGDLIDDADPVGGQTVSSGAIVVGVAGAQWIGDIPVGGVVTVVAALQVKNPDPGNQVLANTLVSAVPGNNCPSGGTDPDCSVSVAVLLPGLTISKTADTPFAVPGLTVGFTVTIANSGTAPYTAAVVTDALAGALDDADFNADATATLGAVSFTGSTLTWTGDLAVGASAVVTYTMTVDSPDLGDKVMVDRLASTEAGSTCPPASSNPDCAVLIAVLTPALSIATSAAVATITAGGTVGYTTTITNTGQTLQSGISVTSALAGVLDDAVFNNDAVASGGAVAFTSPNLVWTGTIAPGSTVSITYSVTVTNPDAGNRILVSTVSSAAAGNNCGAGSIDPACTATVTVSVLSIVNSADVATATPGAPVRFTTTVVNTGQTPYVGINIDASFVGSLDDGAYTGDAAASSGTLVLNPLNGTVRWTGDLAVGATLVVTGSFIVRDPDPGDKTMTSVVSSAVPGNNCPAGGTDPACTATVTILIPALAIVKTADTATTTPGGTVGYTITATNTGETAYTAATITDSLAGLVDDATYDADASATTGVVSYTAPTLSWTGDLAPGAAVTITYTVTADNPDPGQFVLTNTVASNASGNNCATGSTDPVCTVTVIVLVPELSITKSADTSTTVPGATVGYTITITNTGQTDYATATASDPLTGVLDDATYNGNATATTGDLSYTAPTLSWSGALAVGASATITYTVVVNSPSSGDRSLANAVTSTTPGATCPPAGTDPACAATVAVLIPALAITNVADVATSTPGGVIRFTATFTNTGPTPYTGTQIVTNAANVFDDARPNGDQVASSGVLTIVGAAVTWTGDIPIGGVVTVTGTVTVNSPDHGNHAITSTITTNAAGSNCPTGAAGPECTVHVTVLIPALSIVKTADSPTTTPGSTLGYTITATNTGETTYTGATIADNLTALLDDAVYNNDAQATTGVMSYITPNLTWTGDLAPNAAVTITYTIAVNIPHTGEFLLSNTVSSTAPANNCPAGSTDPLCTANVEVLIPELTITKTADTATVPAGQSVTYTVTVANTGQTPYTGATFDDPLTTVLDDATYNNDATATSGDVSYAAPTLSWTGDLAIGATATVTYTVTVTFPETGDRVLANTVSSTNFDANCPAGGTDPACTATVAVLIPALTITKTADTATVVAGATVHYTITIANTGESPYPAAAVTDALAGVLDDATYGNDASATTGSLTYTAPTLTWTGALPIGATAVITYTVQANQPQTGDGDLVNAVTSTDTGSTCPTGGLDPDCTTSTAVAAQTISLSSLPTGFALNGLPDSVATQDEAVSMTVTTNSPTGYSVTVRATAAQLTAAIPANTSTIPIGNLQVRETGTSTYQPLSDQAAVSVHNQNTPSAAGGDAISNDYQALIPFIASDTYSVTLEYIAITQ